MLLYYLDYSVAGAWGDAKKALHWINASMYGIIDYISPQLKINDGYEFFLDFPEINKHVIWYQKNNPLQEKKTCQNIAVEGYVKKAGNLNDFQGLYYSDADHSLLDGSYECSSGWFDIGRPGSYTENGVTGIPGPGVVVNKTILWIRVNSINKCTNYKQTSIDFRYLLFIIINIC